MGQLSRLEGRETCAASKKRISADCEIVWTRSLETAKATAPACSLKPRSSLVGYDRRTDRRRLELPVGDTQIILEVRDERIELVAVGKLVEDTVDRDREPLFVCL
jgi:hypothetical protein